MPVATLPGPSRTIVVEPLEAPAVPAAPPAPEREAPPPEPEREPARPAPA